MQAELVPALPWHADAIAANARQADIDELWAQGRSSPLRALRYGMKVCPRARTGLLDGEPVCMFGVTPYSILRGQGVPWMVGTRALEGLSAQKALLRVSEQVMGGWMGEYSLLFNFVDQRNVAAHRWLRWLGFTLRDPVPYGPDHLPFHPFFWSS